MSERSGCLRGLVVVLVIASSAPPYGWTQEPEQGNGGVPRAGVGRPVKDGPTYRKINNGSPEWGKDEDDFRHPPPHMLARLLKENGGVRFAATAGSDRVGDFLNQGVAQLHVFAHREAERSFKQAEQLDPGCLMAYWGLRWPTFTMRNGPWISWSPAANAFVESRAKRCTLTPWKPT